MTVEQVRALHHQVAGELGGEGGVRDRSALEEALRRPSATRQGIPVHPTLLSQVAALFDALLERRPFAAYNRCTALVAALALLDEKGYRLRATPDEMARLIKSVEVGLLSNGRLMIWFKSHLVRERG